MITFLCNLHSLAVTTSCYLAKLLLGFNTITQHEILAGKAMDSHVMRQPLIASASVSRRDLTPNITVVALHYGAQTGDDTKPDSKTDDGDEPGDSDGESAARQNSSQRHELTRKAVFDALIHHAGLSNVVQEWAVAKAEGSTDEPPAALATTWKRAGALIAAAAASACQAKPISPTSDEDNINHRMTVLQQAAAYLKTLEPMVEVPDASTASAAPVPGNPPAFARRPSVGDNNGKRNTPKNKAMLKRAQSRQKWGNLTTEAVQVQSLLNLANWRLGEQHNREDDNEKDAASRAVDHVCSCLKNCLDVDALKEARRVRRIRAESRIAGLGMLCKILEQGGCAPDSAYAKTQTHAVLASVVVRA